MLKGKNLNCVIFSLTVILPYHRKTAYSHYYVFSFLKLLGMIQRTTSEVLLLEIFPESFMLSFIMPKKLFLKVGGLSKNMECDMGICSRRRQFPGISDFFVLVQVLSVHAWE